MMAGSFPTHSKMIYFIYDMFVICYFTISGCLCYTQLVRIVQNII